MRIDDGSGRRIPLQEELRSASSLTEMIRLEKAISESGASVGDYSIYTFLVNEASTYDHRAWRTGLPVR